MIFFWKIKNFSYILYEIKKLTLRSFDKKYILHSKQKGYAPQPAYNKGNYQRGYAPQPAYNKGGYQKGYGNRGYAPQPAYNKGGYQPNNRGYYQ